MIHRKEYNPEVWYATDAVIKIDSSDVELLSKEAARNPRERIRLCTHKDTQESLHEMLIVHARGCYVRPHKHLNKTESFHIVKGEADVVLLNEMAQILEVIRMGDYASGLNFYYKLTQPLYHTLLIRSDTLVFHETTTGPFNRDDTVFLAGTPEIDDLKGSQQYLTSLEALINERRNA